MCRCCFKVSHPKATFSTHTIAPYMSPNIKINSDKLVKEVRPLSVQDTGKKHGII